MPRDLSTGEQQRVMVARAVISRPRLLLADEPTSALDASLADRTIHLLRELNRLGSTVIVATRDDALAGRYPAPALQISQNSLVESG
jgi:cell division transport system ATP-binding protein